ncbi:hypothetical protein MVEN_01376400 [Mycena venus]|uniref:Uncharacterized protein n=1 Tax=Mycena venus TaxID=2733690 RepID=A0A8H6XUW4_9AGAR|nr:hypothetical protein MVEN_01376400 [Mycena venus]
MAAGVSLALFVTIAAGLIVPWFYFSIHKAPRTAIDLHPVSAQHISPPALTLLPIPLNTPTDAIRSILIQQSDTGELPTPLETLLKHLGSFDVKTYYVRFGHSVVSTCDYCLSFEEFGMFALPRALLSYICATAVIGLVTIVNSGRERYRTLAVAAVAGAFCLEGYYISTWHDTLLLARRLLFLLLPPFVHMLPASASAAALVNPTITAMRAAEQTALRLQLLRLVRGAVMRVPHLRTRAADWWAAEAREGEWVTEDEGVRELARKLNSGFDEGSEGEATGPLRTNARNSVNTLKMGFAPSEYWRVPPP